MFQLNQFNVKKIEEREDYGLFEIGPLPRGYGHTVANILRRILMSSIEGAAITSVKIGGIKHEYSSLEGVHDDILKVLLGLKNVVLVSHSEDPQVLKLNVKGGAKAKEVKAGDIETTGEVEIVNPDYVITTLSGPKAKIEAEIIVETGIGYKYPDESKRKEIGVLPLDANFSPVRRINTRIVQARVGQQTDLDQVNLEVYTNRAVKASDVLLKAVQALDEVANRFVSLLGGTPKEIEYIQDEPEVEEKKVQLPIEDLGLSTRLTNALVNSHYKDLVELEGMGMEDFMSIKGMGQKSVEELYEVMKENGLETKE
ncbi:DNA-directed RNA polymerase subunit alpha [Candidatus Dojkabacteria bacterium]|nr:DNA-directed RNA polymerase subunit alpha [Candidatus Dojkabacteria bacterium]